MSMNIFLMWSVANPKIKKSTNRKNITKNLKKNRSLTVSLPFNQNLELKLKIFNKREEDLYHWEEQ